MSRAPSKPVARLLRRDEFVLIEPGTNVVALGRPLEANLTLVTCCTDTGAHDIETERPALIAKMKNLTVDNAVVSLNCKAVRLGQIGDMDPGPSSITIAAENRVALFRHRKPVRADAVETIVPKHEARSQNNGADIAGC